MLVHLLTVATSSAPRCTRPLRCPDFPGDAPLAVQLAFLGHRVVHLIERRLDRLDYSHTQAAIIIALHRRPGLMAQDLVGPIPVEPPSVTRALQALERRGLICRQPHPTDGRASLLYLTQSGQEASAAIDELWRDTSAELETGVAPAELATLRAALQTLVAATEETKVVPL